MFRSPGFPLQLFCSLTCAAVSMAAQAPVITPAGDPSVRDDTIYRLAVDRRAFADQEFVYLLDDGVVRFELDGTGVMTWREVVQVLTPEAVKRWGELSLEYSPSHEKFTLNWVRVLDSAGHLISARPAYETEVAASRGSDAGLSADRIAHRLSLAGVEPGVILDYSYSVRIEKPRLPREYFTQWRILNGQQTQRSRFLLDLPWNAEPRIRERNLTFQRTETEVKGRRVYVWYTRNIKKPDREPFAPDSAYVEDVTILSPRKWIDISKLYARYANHSYELQPTHQREVIAALDGARTRDDSLSRLYTWSATRPPCRETADTAYRPPDLAARCPSRATLFLAAARWLGFQAYPVLVSIMAPVDTAYPSLLFFDHEIAAVESSEDQFQFFDPAADRVPYRELPPYEQGRFGLLVRDDGEYAKVRFPVPPPSANRVAVALVGELNAAGRFRGEWTISAGGNRRYAMRALLASGSLPDSAQRRRCARSIEDSILTGSDSLSARGGGGSRTDTTLFTQLCGVGLLTDQGSFTILELPLLNLADRRVVSMLEGRGPRLMPIDAGRASGNFEFVEQLRLSLPPGWRARLPVNVQSSSVFGVYEATYAQVGAELRVTRRWLGATGVFPASRYSELKEWLRQKAGDDVTVVVIDK